MLGWRASWEKDSTVASPGDSPPPPLRDASRCVILSRGDDISPGFLASLKQRGVESVIIGRPLLAFAELLVMERERGPSSGWGLPERNRTLFIVADRERWEQLDQLLGAIRSHLPRVAVWVAAADLLLDVTEPPLSRRDGGQGEDDILAGLPRLRLTGGEAESNDPVRRDAHDRSVSRTAGSGVGDIDRNAPEASVLGEEANGRLALPHEAEAESEPEDFEIASSGSNSAAVTPEEIEMLLRVLPPTPPKRPGSSDPTRPEDGR